MGNSAGEKIRRLRREKGLTLEQLAERTESSKSYIWDLENRNPPRPSADKLAKIAAALDTTIDFIIDQEGAVSQSDATDAKFYREYRQMDEATKEKIRKMVELWGE